MGKKRLKAGDLDRYVSLQSPVVATASTGEVTVTGWTTQAHRYASVEALSGRELWLAQQVQSDATYRIRMRPVPGMTDRWSVLYGTRRFQLLTPPLDPDGDNEQAEVLAVEQVT